MQRLASFALGTLLVASISGTTLGACVSSENNPLAPGGSTSPDLDATSPLAPPRHDAGSIADSSTVDSTILPPPPADDAGASSEDSATSATDATDSATTAVDAGDSAPSADAGVADAAYNDVYAPSDWTAFDTTGLDAGLGSFNGATFDGRYVYFAPYGSSPNDDGIIARFDTTQGYTAGGWSTVDAKVTGALSGSGRFGGALFDGRYVYFVANTNSPTPSESLADQTFIRYDTTGGFASPGSWSQFDASGLANVNSQEEFLGGTFDGRYVYFASYFFTTVVIYDTQGAFASASSWNTFDTSTLNPPELDFGSIVFSGTVFDGTYVYFLGPIVARYDTTNALGIDAGTSAWESFNAQGLPGASSIAWAFGGYDGRYVYMLNAGSDLVAQYDTQSPSPFTSASSWATFDVSTAGGAAGGYRAADFDGRYLYLAPNSTTFAIYDTKAPFGSTSSWTTFNASAVPGAPTSYQSMVFDGEHLYAAAYLNEGILRVDLKTASGGLPGLPQFHGSFF